MQSRFKIVTWNLTNFPSLWMLGYHLNSYRAYLQKLTSQKQIEKLLSYLIPTTKVAWVQQHQVHDGLGGGWGLVLVYRVTCYSHCGEGITAHYAPRGALLIGRASGAEASIWRVEDTHLLILADIRSCFLVTWAYHCSVVTGACTQLHCLIYPP